MDENRAEYDECDDWLDGLCQEFLLGLWVAAIGVRQLGDGKGGNENGA